MKTEVVDVSPTRKEIKIEIAPEEVRAEYDRVSQRYAQMARVPGFRPGKAPVSVVRQRFKNEIRGEVLQAIVPQALTDAITKNNLNIVGEPDVHLDNDAGLDKLGEQPLSVHANVEVFPEVALGEYKGLEVARRTRPVTDEDVNRLVENLREQSATLEPVEDRGAQEGDTVTIDIRGHFVEPQEKHEEEEIKADEVDIVIGGEGVLKEFNENLTGARVDDVREFRVSYPEDFNAKGLAGKTVDYKATVTAVRRKETPELNDEWVESLGEEEVKTVEQLRQRLRDNLEARAKDESEGRLRDDLMSKLIGAHQFEVPSSLIEHQTRHHVERAIRDMLARGIDPRKQEMDWEGMSRVLRDQAETDLRGSLLLERIAESENIDVSDEEINKEIEAYAEMTRQTPDQVRAALTKQGGERSIADRLRQRKAIDFLVANARVSDEEWREEEVEKAESETEANAVGAESSASDSEATSENASPESQT